MTKHHRKEFFTSLKTKNGFLSSHSSFGHSLIFLFLPKTDDEITFNCAILFPAIVYVTLDNENSNCHKIRLLFLSTSWDFKIYYKCCNTKMYRYCNYILHRSNCSKINCGKYQILSKNQRK